MTIIHADCLDLLDELGAADVMITDPPYSPHVHASMMTNNSRDATGSRAPQSRDVGFAPLSEALRFGIIYLASRVKRWSCIFSDFEGLPDWWEEQSTQGVEHVRVVPWIRWSQPQISGDRPPQGAEAVEICHRQEVGPRGGVRPIAKHWNGSGSLTFLDARCMRGKEKHPTEKPLDLMLTLVSAFSDVGELVVDPCGGRGTTALACRLLGRACIAAEIDEWEAKLAEERETAALGMRDANRAGEWVAAVVADCERQELLMDRNEPCWDRLMRAKEDALRVAGEL